MSKKKQKFFIKLFLCKIQQMIIDLKGKSILECYRLFNQSEYEDNIPDDLKRTKSQMQILISNFQMVMFMLFTQKQKVFLLK